MIDEPGPLIDDLRWYMMIYNWTFWKILKHGDRTIETNTVQGLTKPSAKTAE